MNDYQKKFQVSSDTNNNNTDSFESELSASKTPGIGKRQTEAMDSDQLDSKEQQNTTSNEFIKNFKQASMNIINEIQLVKTLFQVKQIKCKLN